MALAFGSKKQNFGLSTNMTLPISGSAIEPDPKILAENAFMPEERKPKRKKRARFAIDQEESAETKVCEALKIIEKMHFACATANFLAECRT